jgi:UDPglucose--hexose-1-phosphate uridylyltransferase
VIAPHRAERPGAGWPHVEAATSAELDSCPFCAAREDRTPPETLRIGDPWRVRVVPNLYPAFQRQEVVVHAPEHVRTVAELDDDQLALVADAWQRRERATPGYLHALINEGRVAGGSLAHSHSQLVWLPDVPPAVVREENLRRALEQGFEVLERDGIIAACSYAPRLPYETIVAPLTPEADPFTSDLLAPALAVLAELVRRLHWIGNGPIPLNAWLHHGEWWHLELVPRLTALAGIELGAEIYVNTVAPEDAAEQLRLATMTDAEAGA